MCRPIAHPQLSTADTRRRLSGPWAWSAARYFLHDGAPPGATSTSSFSADALGALRTLGSVVRTQTDTNTVEFTFDAPGEPADGGRSSPAAEAPLTIDLGVSYSEGGVGAVMWDSAVAMTLYLRSMRPFARSAKVLELGAGLGLPGACPVHQDARVPVQSPLPPSRAGLSLAARGAASHVTLTDGKLSLIRRDGARPSGRHTPMPLIPRAGCFARTPRAAVRLDTSVWRSSAGAMGRTAPAPTQTQTGCPAWKARATYCSARPAITTPAPTCRTSQVVPSPCRHVASTRWQPPCAAGAYDVVLGSDIAYSDASAADLVDLIAALGARRTLLVSPILRPQTAYIAQRLAEADPRLRITERRLTLSV